MPALVVSLMLLAQLNSFFALFNDKSNEWNSKFLFTRQINSQLTIDCGLIDQIWIGWSHYGTRNIFKNNNGNLVTQIAKTANSNTLNSNGSKNVEIRNNQEFNLIYFPNESDCWMNFTDKIAEQCNGLFQCALSTQSTFIHKCGKISDYLYVSYKCVRAADTYDICQSVTRTFNHPEPTANNGVSSSVYIKSSDFPTEYGVSLDCSCSIESSLKLKMEVMWFSLQVNDFLTIFNKNLSGWINPMSEWPLTASHTTIRFMTDDALAQKGFWLKLAPRKQCKKDWQLVGDNCVKVFRDAVDWRLANKRCQQMNSNLLKIDDVVDDLKLTQYMKTYYPEVSSYWIGFRKHLMNVSWWLWKDVTSVAASSKNIVGGPKTTSAYAQVVVDGSSASSNQINNCVTKRKNENGYFTTSCDPAIKNSFICQSQAMYPTNNKMSLKCGPTDEFKRLMKNTQNLNSIGVNSIKNIMMPHIFTTASIKKSAVSLSNQKVKSRKNHIDLEKKTLFNWQTTKKWQVLTKLRKLSHSDEKQTEATLKGVNSLQTPQKINTTVLVVIISGIGLVNVLINLVVLFLCRRNFQNYLKSSSVSSFYSLSLSKNFRINREDLQEYFETSNTLHYYHPILKRKKTLNLLKSGETCKSNYKSPYLPRVLMNTTHRLQHQQQSTIYNNISSCRSCNELAKMLYNQSYLLPSIQSQLLCSSQEIKLHFLLHFQQKDNQHQVQNEKMNQQIVPKYNELMTSISYNDASDQQHPQHYAHTYECLDNLEMEKFVKPYRIRPYQTVLSDLDLEE